MIEVEHLTKLYGSLAAVADLSFRVEAAEIVGLVGPNGAGKTTTLRCLAGIIPPTSGDIRIAGYDLSKDPLEAKRRNAFVPDEPRLFDYLTVAEHLEFTARLYGVGADRAARAEALLTELDLTGKRDALPTELSRGMKQKLQIACGLIHVPEALVFDEPLTGLDPVGIRRIKTLILQRARAGAAVIVSSHLLHLVEELCSRIVILDRGRKVIDGTLEEIAQGVPEVGGGLEAIFLKVTGHGDER